MTCIEIIAPPPCEAPEEIRQSWIGVVIPLPPNAQEVQEQSGFGVLTGPRFLAWLPYFRKKSVKYHGYRVRTLDAIQALAKRDEAAAEWWRKNTPHLMKPSARLLFREDVCRIVEQ